MRKNVAFRTENGKSLALSLLKPLAFRDQSTHIRWRNHRKKHERRLRRRKKEVTRRPRPTPTSFSSSSSPLAAAATVLTDCRSYDKKKREKLNTFRKGKETLTTEKKKKLFVC
jgi:hypothetical protein